MRAAISGMIVAITVLRATANAQQSFPPPVPPATLAPSVAPRVAPEARPSAAPRPPAAPPNGAPPGATAPVEPSPKTEPRVSKSAEIAAVPVTAKWADTLYGFVQLDGILDSTESFTEVMGNNAVARPGTYAGDHGRWQLSARHSRLGFKLSSPPSETVRVMAAIEVDFLGNQPMGITESAFYTNASVRIRQGWLKLETSFVDVLFGQTWGLFGWQPYFFPNTVEIQGLPGQVFARAPQLRFSKVLKSESVNVEFAIAASRSPQRDAAVPDGQAGIRLLINRRTGLHTTGAAGTAADAMGIGVTGAVRRFAVANFSATPTQAVTDAGWGLSVDMLVPIVPGSTDDRANALTFTGSYARGAGDADLYTALTGGLTFPPLPNPTGAMPAPTYTPNIDNGLVAFDASGSLHTIQWQSFLLGLQYYLPPSGRVWIAANYSHLNSGNIDEFGAPGSVFTVANWVSASLLWDVTQAVRLGAEYTWYGQKYASGVDAHNSRGHFIALYIF